jgi:hypothetical protein
LYKYRVFNTYVLECLTEATVYYSDPNAFNDHPLDCKPAIKVDTDLLSLERLYYFLLLKTGFSEQQAQDEIFYLRYNSTAYRDYQEDVSGEKYLKEALLPPKINELIVAEIQGKGVFSLSETWKSPLMWSHYADEHRGICIEYNTALIPHPNIAAVDYRSPRSIKASDLIAWKMKASSEAERRVYNTYFFAKSPEWRYEKEWRDISQSIGVTNSHFPVTAIYFGLRCASAVITSIVKLFNYERDISFFKIYPVDDSFSLKAYPINPDEVEVCGIRLPGSMIFGDAVLPQ